MIAFACIPFIFGLQQATEGCVWLSLTGDAMKAWPNVPADIFLFFSHVLWPVWMPFSIWLCEKDANRKRKLFSLFCLGCILALYHLFYIVTNTPRSEILNCHIDYTMGFPKKLMLLTSILYGITTILPSFISSRKKMWMMGIVLTISYFTTWIFYTQYLISVFCFFAAMLSIVVYFIIRAHRKNQAQI